MKINLNTTHLSLSLLDTSDSAFMLEILNTEGWLKFIGDRNVRTLQQAEDYIEKIKSLSVYYWTARENTTQAPVGIATLLRKDYLQYYDLGYALLPQFCGKGYAREMAQEIIRFATEDLEHQFVEAVVQSDNERSVHLLKIIGFNFEKKIREDNEDLDLYVKTLITSV